MCNFLEWLQRKFSRWSKYELLFHGWLKSNSFQIYMALYDAFSYSQTNMTSYISPFRRCDLWQWNKDQGALSILRYCLTSIGIHMLKIRQSPDCLIFNMGIPIPGKDGLYIETGPRHLRMQHTKDIQYSTEYWNTPDSKVHGANKGPTWVLSTTDGPTWAPLTLLSGAAVHQWQYCTGAEVATCKRH